MAPTPTRLNLKFSHDGTWVLVPMERGDMTGPFYKNHHIARMETYINNDGVKRKAIAYGKDMGTLKVWFDFEAVKAALGSWTFPDVPYYYNNKKWIPKMRKEHEKLENSLQNKKKEEPKKGQSSKGYDSRSGDSEETYHWDRRTYQRSNRYSSDREDDNPSSGVGRSSGPSRRERERESNPGRRRRSKSRDYEEDRYDDRSQSRDRRRGHGAARKQYYGGSGRS